MRFHRNIEWKSYKYKIEQRSVYLTWLTWDLTKSWTEMCPSVRLN